jgi:hypothetical protein
MPSRLEYFDNYTNILGWEIIPILPNKKIPINKEWNGNVYDCQAIRNFLEQNPNFNMGIRLGEIVDVEADSPAANKALHQMTAGVRHPMYQSSRSVHHLFLSPDPKLTKVETKGGIQIEFRGNLHQSLLPPSVVNDVRYKWLTFEFPIPEMPAGLKSFYWRYVQRKRKDNNMKLVACSICEKDRPINRDRYKLEQYAFARLKMPWQCQKCRKDNVRPLCRELRKIL